MYSGANYMSSPQLSFYRLALVRAAQAAAAGTHAAAAGAAATILGYDSDITRRASSSSSCARACAHAFARRGVCLNYRCACGGRPASQSVSRSGDPIKASAG